MQKNKNLALINLTLSVKLSLGGGIFENKKNNVNSFRFNDPYRNFWLPTKRYWV